MMPQGATRVLRSLVQPVTRAMRHQRAWLHDVLIAQARHYRPDVILNHDPVAFSPAFMRELRGSARLMIAQISSPLPRRYDFRDYDFVLSSFPHFVDRFRAGGVNAEPFRLAFERRILDLIPAQPPTTPVSFVGSVMSYHAGRAHLLERLCRELSLPVWGPSQDVELASPGVRRSYQGEAWGRAMYEVLGVSGMTLNNHGEVAESFANNMRLFEATGTPLLSTVRALGVGVRHRSGGARG